MNNQICHERSYNFSLLLSIIHAKILGCSSRCKSKKWFAHQCYDPVYMGVSKNRGTPKWMVYIGKPLLKWDDLGIPLVLETPTSFLPIKTQHCFSSGLLCQRSMSWLCEKAQGEGQGKGLVQRPESILPAPHLIGKKPSNGEIFMNCPFPYFTSRFKG